jgi:hypothetical protein
MKIVVVIFLASTALFLFGCSDRRSSEPIVVHVVRDSATTEIGSALTTLSARQLRTRRGQPIMIATIEAKSYEEDLKELGRETHPEIVIFDSFKEVEAAKVGIPTQGPLRVSTRLFYPVVPYWTSGQQREAAEVVLAGLRKELEK